MMRLSRRYNARRWTGERDWVAAIALFAALLVGAIGFLAIGAATLH